MAKNIKPARDTVLRRFNNAARRTWHLKSLVLRVGYQDPNHNFHLLRNPDKRDLIEFIVFEAASEFEHLAKETFLLAARKQFNVQPKRASYIIGNIDHGRVTGWASPSLIVARSKKLFGKTHFLSKLNSTLPTGTYDVLVHAHKVRNRIAHEGTGLDDTFNYVNVPTNSRKGLSMGRLLLDYKAPSPIDRPLFDAILLSYRAFSRMVAANLK